MAQPPTPKELRKQLKEGDIARLAEITGRSADYVSKVLLGKRKSDFIVVMADKYLSSRERLRQEAKQLKASIRYE